MSRLLAVTTILIVLGAGAIGALAQGNEWPSDMSLGGFRVTGIRGSGASASGNLQFPVVNNPRISLARNSRGEVTGTLPISTRLAGFEMQGNFVLDNGGLRGRGAIRTPARPISDAAIIVHANGIFDGQGRMDLGGSSMPVRFAISPNTAELSGAVPAQAQADTPLATYAFSGEIRLDGGPNRALLTAKGNVQRTGKLTNQVTTCSVSGVQIDPSNGIGKTTIDGVNVMFDFFRR